MLVTVNIRHQYNIANIIDIAFNNPCARANELSILIGNNLSHSSIATSSKCNGDIGD